MHQFEGAARNFRELFRESAELHAQPFEKCRQNEISRDLAASSSDAISDKVSIYHGNITDAELIANNQAIVNPTNNRLWAHQSGVNQVVFAAAGENKLQEACYAVTSQCKRNVVPTGQTAVTPAFNLNIPFVLHTVSPYTANNEDLISCYDSILNLCVMKGIRTVAVPCIGTGEGSFRKQSGCSLALRAVRSWFIEALHTSYDRFVNETEPQQWHGNFAADFRDQRMFQQVEETVADRVDHVVFVCYDDENWALYNSMMTNIFPHSDKKHSYMWRQRLVISRMSQQVEYLKLQNEHLMKAVKQANQDNNSQDNTYDGNNEIHALCDGVEQLMETFKRRHDSNEWSSMVRTNPSKLISTAKVMTHHLKDLQKAREVIDSFSALVRNSNQEIASLAEVNDKTYTEWSVDEIIVWVSSLDDGFFVPYLEQLRIGLVASHITSGVFLPELTRPDLSVEPFAIHNFQVKKKLVEHFESLHIPNPQGEKEGC